MRSSTFVALLVLISIPAAAAELTRDGADICVTIDGEPLAVYRTESEHARPFFAEVRIDGDVITRPINPPGGDHPHHTGLWIAVDEVNGVAFWHLEGAIVNRSVELTEPRGNPAVMTVVSEWRDARSTPLLRETTRVAVFDDRLLAYDISLKALDQPVTFGDTEEGFFAIRLADTMCEEQTGQIVNADGRQTAAGSWGRTSPWVDYSGRVDGRLCGVALLDHPDNFRQSRYHVRDYGLFTISPFGEGDYTEGRQPPQPVQLAPGETLRLQYGMYLHKGDAAKARVDDAHRRYVQAARTLRETFPH